ncbi:hypothetical protein E2C01_071879 [Portunus trituberculatus]|uniref:Protein kinase domain-containing protein n=1 Tax=Portunus trituberculatus TaxID=210409 RepID=A0A5B7I691_PORTR|nr:hypothetical protein [Portunus trituberculatus]
MSGDKQHEASQTTSGQGWHDDWNVWEDPHPTTDNPPAEEGLLGELILRKLPNLPWVEAESGVVFLVELGRGSCGDYCGELLVRKRFYETNAKDDEAYSLWLLGGSRRCANPARLSEGAALPLRDLLRLRHTGGVLRLGPEAGRLLEVLFDLTLRVVEIHTSGLVHLDLKGENVMVQDTHTG